MNSGISAEAMALHREAVVIDLHADTPLLMRHGYDFLKRHAPPLPAAAAVWHLDLPRMIEGGLTAVLFGIVTFPLWRRGMMRSALDQIGRVEAATRASGGRFRLATGPGDVLAAKRGGSAAGIVSLEGAHALGGEMENLKTLADRGLKSLGLVHFSRNEAASPAFGRGASRDEGLTPFGRDLVRACNDLGVLVDLAHLNRPGFIEAASLSRAPVLVSHTGLSGVRPMWRNVDDRQVRAVAETGGCVGIIFSRGFLGGPGIDAVVAHVKRCIAVGGEDAPAIGSDFDGWVVPPRGLQDVAALPRLTDALLRAGLAPGVVLKVLGGNALRVLGSSA